MVSGTTKDRRRYYIVKANRLPRFEEEINVDLPAFYAYPQGKRSKTQMVVRQGTYLQSLQQEVIREDGEVLSTSETVWGCSLLVRPPGPLQQGYQPYSSGHPQGDARSFLRYVSWPFLGPLTLSGVNLHCALVDYSC